MPEHGANPAFYNDDHEIMRYLVEHGANVKNVPIRGNYPKLLYSTVERKSLLHCRALVQLGTDLKIKGNCMRTPLFFAADFIDPQFEILELLWFEGSQHSRDDKTGTYCISSQEPWSRNLEDHHMAYRSRSWPPL